MIPPFLSEESFDAARQPAEAEHDTGHGEGGAACREFDPETMESHIVKGLHAAGELLDVDGDCGGFNLMFAFSSGILAGLNGREEERK